MSVMKENKMKKAITLTAVALAAAAAFGCSGFAWHTEDGCHLLGRTYDMFGDLSGNNITVIAPGYELHTSPSGTGETVTMEYGFVGNAIQGSASPIFTDGINEKGLMGTLQNFPGYGHYNTQVSDGNLNLHPAFFVPYMLGTCESVEEVAEAVTHLNLTDELIFGANMSVHYIFSDETGEAIIIEPDEDGITVHRSTIGVMTNAPGYDWQHTNLKNYVAVSNVHTPPRELLGETVSTFGNGTGGSFGLPGSYSSPDRFVRLAFAKNFAPLGKNEIDGITRMFDTFSVVYVPDGMLKESADHDEYERTLCTTAMCAESRTYYFSPAENRRISAYNVMNALEAMGEGETIALYPIPIEEDINYVI